ncbi:hypothetical protein CPB84DRAFT_1815119 [Gymnopilus junonius]|uniref:Uncharacterized protein n=1 Tax=Gymnopilus junonius TaxID=109634 RepID=A0A9P5TNV3_GYMJU|nr:hypothetical protein CPB84DRAFT_1815119 [Gymnopilus junonius]
MPVPVPRQSKPLAHPVVKRSHRAVGQTIQTHILPGFLPGPPQELPPPSTREEWLSSLPSWRRPSQRLSLDDDRLSAQHHHTQDFYLGLAGAGNAPVIKGAPAEACIPPVHGFFEYDQAPIKVIHATEQLTAPQSIDVQMVLDNSSSSRGMLHSALQQNDDVPIGQNVLAAAASRVQPHTYSSDSSPLGFLTDSATLCNRSYHPGAFSPIFEDQSPGLASGPDSGSSPLEPLTPFGDFVDRAVAGAQHAVLDDLYVERSAHVEDHQEKQVIPDVYQAVPIFPTIADAPGQQDLISDTVTFGATSGYKKLAEPLSEWVANYVWKICTTGFNLPPAFTQPSINAGPYAVAVPSYLAPSIHSLLLSTLLQPSAVFLSIWYIVRLPVCFRSAPLTGEFVKENALRATLLDTGTGLERDTVEASAAFRLVVLGCMLSNKWLDDHTFSNKTWHSISNIPLETLNNLESLALDIFNYDLSISSQQWSEWISHVFAYHQSLSAPTYLQPISRPSSNPHSIVRLSIEEILQGSTCNSSAKIPQPFFLGLAERLRERQEKEQAMDFEIDLDEDGPLREEYMPKRRASKLGSQVAPLDSVSVDKWNIYERAVKTLPPPAKWSPAGDEPILRDRNRVSGQYVAVQAPALLAMAYPANREVAYSQNWSASTYMPIKSQTGYMYDVPSVFGINQHSYHPLGYIPSNPTPHSRSMSQSYEQELLMSHDHIRSYSQTQLEYKCDNLRMTANEYLQYPENDHRWMEAAGHYYPGPAFIHVPTVGMQPAW